MGKASELLRDQGRGILGALIVGTPLLFTMETWWLAWRLPFWLVLLFAFGGLVVILTAVRFGGFREKEERPHGTLDWMRQFTELVLQSLSAAYLVMFTFGILGATDTLVDVTRLGLLQLVPLGLGAALANSILKSSMEEEAQRSPLAKKIAIFALGALFFTLAIAPTEEVALMAAHAGWWGLFGVVALSLVATYLALYELGFRGQSGRATSRPAFHAGETCLVYVVGLVVAAALMAGYGQLHDATFAVGVQYVVVMGFPAAMGGAAEQVVL